MTDNILSIMLSFHTVIQQTLNSKLSISLANYTVIQQTLDRQT